MGSTQNQQISENYLSRDLWVVPGSWLFFAVFLSSSYLTHQQILVATLGKTLKSVRLFFQPGSSQPSTFSTSPSQTSSSLSSFSSSPISSSARQSGQASLACKSCETLTTLYMFLRRSWSRQSSHTQQENQVGYWFEMSIIPQTRNIFINLLGFLHIVFGLQMHFLNTIDLLCSSMTLSKISQIIFYFRWSHQKYMPPWLRGNQKQN